MNHEIVVFDASKEAKKRGAKRGLRLTSNFLLIFSFILALFIFGPIFTKTIQLQLAGKNPASQVKFGDLLGQISLINLSAPDANFSIVVPKINVRAKIVANVDPANPKEYQAVLKENVAHAKGTTFPGMDGAVYLFGHSSQFPTGVIDGAVFALLDKLEPGDQIVVYFSGVRYIYAVTEKKILETSDLRYYHEKTQESRLILQTCWPPGTSKWQLVVFARPVYLLTRVRDWEAEEPFFNKLRYVFEDKKHSAKEKRYGLFGQTNKGRLLAIVFTMRKGKTRIITARDISRRERRSYEEIKINS